MTVLNALTLMGGFGFVGWKLAAVMAGSVVKRFRPLNHIQYSGTLNTKMRAIWEMSVEWRK